MQELLPLALYEQILENMPICCIDAVVRKGKKALLVKRINEPEKNEWWVPGGRIRKGESLDDAAKRIIKEETGMEIENERVLKVYEYHSGKTNFEKVKTGTHSIVIGYYAQVSENSRVILDKTSSDYRWISRIEDNLKDYVKKILRDSGVFD